VRQEPECCEVCHVAVCYMSMICNVQTQGSANSPSVKKIGGPYMCYRSRSDWAPGVRCRQSMCCVLIVTPFFLGYSTILHNLLKLVANGLLFNAIIHCMTILIISNFTISPQTLVLIVHKLHTVHNANYNIHYTHTTFKQGSGFGNFLLQVGE
jgi:hypothetical protein